MKINLRKEMFTEKEFVLAESGAMRATAFRYSTGVEALKIENKKGYIIVLPFQGQGVWDICFGGRSLKMKTTVKEPVANVSYLETYGGFLYHCGVGNIGAPDSSHPHHGEIPNKAYGEAHLLVDTDEKGTFMALGGALDLDIAFVRKYQFRPECRLYEDASVLNVHVELENKRADAMEYAYLCHINFIPMNGAKIIDNATMKTVHKVIPDSFTDAQKADLGGYMDRLEADRSVGDTVGAPGQFYKPEICCTMIYDGTRGKTMQYVEGEGACFVDHDAVALPYTIRWISRTETEDSMGMALPATCEHLGYDYAKANGQMKYLGGFETLKFDITAGWIDDDAAKKVKTELGK